MLAEIHGKLENHMEDELTGNVFGTLRYTSFNKILKPLLKSCVNPKNFAAAIDKIDCEFWGDKIKFWERDVDGEIDLLLTFDEIILGIEMKFLSGLSGEDQLEREAGIIARKADGREKFLLLMATEGACLEIITDNERKNFLKKFGVQLGYIAWENFFDALKNFNNLNLYENLIVDDLIKLLMCKGFDGFRSFDLSDTENISSDDYWNFEKGDIMTAKTDENIINAAAVMRKTHENFMKFFGQCKKIVAEKNCGYKLLTERFLRYNSDVNFYGFMLTDPVILFKRNDTATNIVYGVEVNFVEGHVKLLKYFYNEDFNYNARISPAEYVKFAEPLWTFEKIPVGDYIRINIPPDKQAKYNDANKIIYTTILISEVTAKTVEEKIFGTLEKISAQI